MQSGVEVGAQPGPARQRIGQQDACDPQRQPSPHHVGGRLPLQRRPHDGVEQQHWKQEKIDQVFQRLPDAPVQGSEAAQQIAAQDEGEIGE